MFDRQKFKKLVHYICFRRKDNPSSLGYVKLNKILWLSDFVSFYRLGESLTDARYVKRQFGPVPHQIVPVLKELENEGALKIEEKMYFGRPKKSFVVYKDVRDDFLPPEEKRIVDSMIDFVCDEHTASSISERSHDDVWKFAKDGEELPYYTIFSNKGLITPEDREWAQSKLESTNG